MRVPWIARRSNQSILKEIGPEYCSSTLASRCEELTHWKRPWCWERQRAGGEGGDRGRDGRMVSWTQWTMSLSKVWEIVKNKEAWHGRKELDVGLFATPWTVAHQPPLDFPGKNTGVGCHFLLQGIFPNQGSNPGLLCCWQTLYCLSH